MLTTTNRFMALCPGLPGWAGTRRNTHPLTYPDHHPTFISFFHLLRSNASSLFNLRAWQPFCTTSLQVLFDLRLGLEPSTSYSIHLFTQSCLLFATHAHAIVRAVEDTKKFWSVPTGRTGLEQVDLRRNWLMTIKLVHVSTRACVD